MSNRFWVNVIMVLALAAVCVSASWAACGQTCGAACGQASPIKVLFEVGGPVHDAVKQPALMKKLLEDTKQFSVTVTEDRDQFKAANINKYDLVMIYTTSGSLTPEQEQGVVKFVENGKGLVGIHSATDSFHNSDAYWKLVCGKFIGHNHGTFKVKITAKSHSIVQGMQDFEITDETYRDDFHPQSKPIVLMRRVEDNEPSAWVQYYGKGRVFVTGLGHGMEAWTNPAFQNMITRALLWADGKINP